jgi:hypothetical protein
MNALKTRALLFFSLILLSATCKKTDTNITALPPATQNGSNTMGAKINGVIWINNYTCDCIGGGTSLPVSHYNSDFGFSGYNLDKLGKRTDITLNIHGLTQTGEYPLSKYIVPTLVNSYAEVTIDQNSNSLDYQTDYTYLGTVTITKFDPTNRIISGTFQFDALNQNNPNDIVHITEGRFDVTY